MPLKIVSAVLTAAAVLVSMPQVAGAMDPKWPPGPYKYVVIEQDLKDALIEFGRNINVPVKVSDEVKGKLRGDLGAGRPRSSSSGSRQATVLFGISMAPCCTSTPRPNCERK